MSGHNPHSHLSQPNSSWNPLQIPSYIPRQPQVAHMSNERSLVRSPITWHTPAPPEALYNFISANHKTLELNPLLPSFVRGPAPFGSVDLTMQSTRNNSVTSPRNLPSPSQDFTHSKQTTHNIIPNNLQNPNVALGPGVIQSTGSVRDKFSTSNGNNCDLPLSGGLFIRDARQINNELIKAALRESDEVAPIINEPVELVSQSSKIIATKTSPKKLSPPRASFLSNQISISPESKSPIPTLNVHDLGTNVEVPNNHVSSVSQQASNEAMAIENSPLCATALSPSNNTSNEDSVDSNSNTSKNRRRRKPDRVIRVPNDSDESLSLNEKGNSIIFFKHSAESDVPLEKNNLSQDDEGEFQTSLVEKETNVSKVENCMTVESSVETVNKDKKKKDDEELPFSCENVEDNKLESVIVDNITNRVDSGLKDLESRLREHAQVEAESMKQHEDMSSLENCTENSNERVKCKNDLDDIETIDKIAAMIAHSNENEEITENDGENNLVSTHVEIQIDKPKSELDNNKITDLTEVLSDSTKNQNDNYLITNQDNTEKEVRFKEIENKLEEMFAGIEDEQPSTSNSKISGTINDQVPNEVISDLGLDQPQGDKSEMLSLVEKDDAEASSSQKRSLTTKSDLPTKKKRIPKKVTTPKKLLNRKSGGGNKSPPDDKIVKERVKEKEEITIDNKIKGPYVHLKPDGSMNIVNTPIMEDDTEKQNKAKKSLQNHTQERSKIRGMHISTLSMKYDAETIDATWMCVFCKNGPHKNGLGDLFGPYIVATNCDEFKLNQRDFVDDEFVSKRTKLQMVQKNPNLPVVAATHHNGGTSTKKKKRTNDSLSMQKTQTSEVDLNEIFVGMLKVSDTSYEVWVHEDCAVWASGVHMVGSRIIGLETAIWSSVRYKCTVCSLNGAMICCLQRGCSSRAHISCSRYKKWTLHEKDFNSFCDKHSSEVVS